MFLTFHLVTEAPGLPADASSLSIYDHLRVAHPTLNLNRCVYLSLQLVTSGADVYLGSTPDVHPQSANTGLKLPSPDAFVFQAQGKDFIPLTDMYLVSNSVA